MLIKTQSSLKRAIFSKKETMKDEEIFTSNAYREFLEQIITGLVPNYSPSVCVEESDFVACTDGNQTIIGLNNPFIEKATNAVEKNRCYVGLNLHETGHILFTDFRLAEKVVEKLKERSIYPAPSKEVSERTIEIVEIANTSLLIRFLMEISNCIEDGFVDRTMMKLVPGYGKCLAFIRALDKADTPTYRQMQEEMLPKEAIFLNCVLFYARFGIRAYEDRDEDDTLVKAFQPCEEIIAKAVMEPIPMKRMKATWEVFSHFIDFVYKETEEEEKEEESGEGSPDKSEGKGKGESKETDGTGETGEEKPASKETSAEKIGEKLEKCSSSLPEVEKGVKRSASTAPKKEALEKAAEAAESEEIKGIPKEESSEFGEKMMDSLKEKAAAEEITKEQEEEIRKDLEKEMDSDAFGIHTNVRSQVWRAYPSPTGRKRFEEQHRMLDTEVRRFIRDFKKEIDDRQIGGCQKGLFFGKELTVDQIYRKDKRIFNNKIAPEDIPDMAVGVLVDLSGSMGSGERMPKARECAYITYRFCREMGIPCFVVGHTVKGRYMTYVSVADENSLDGKDEQRIFSLEAGGDNRDGLALKYCYRKLQNIEAEQKILCVISDGQPCDYSSDGVGYGMSNGKPDCQAAVKEAIKKSGIQTIVAGIGSDAHSIKDCYKDGISDKVSATFLDFSDMKNLSKCFIKVLKGMLD